MNLNCEMVYAIHALHLVQVEHMYPVERRTKGREKFATVFEGKVSDMNTLVDSL